MRGRRHKLQVSTFPFLAVLLCAMGSLILVLLVMDRKAHQAARNRAMREAARLAEQAAQGEAVRREEKERKRRETLTAREEKSKARHAELTREQVELQLQMRKVREQLGDIAARLRYEQDAGTQLRRKVQDERDRLRAEEQLLATLRGRAGEASAQSQESGQALRRMTLDLLQMEQVLKDLRAARQRQQHTFSVVPYHGRHGESRRPIYVECTAEGVIFHPEGRALPVTSREFLVGHGKPGDEPDDVRREVERRVARQRARLAGTPEANATPYLLLLVRPDGVATYGLFQAVLKDMTLDFGYEFIDADWVLDFPAEDDPAPTQPWMVATKPSTPATPAPAATSPNRTAHPVGLEPSYEGGGGVPTPRGIRTVEGNGQGPRLGGAGTTGGPSGPVAARGSAGGSSTGGGAGGTGPGPPSGAYFPSPGPDDGAPGSGGGPAGGVPSLVLGPQYRPSGRPGAIPSGVPGQPGGSGSEFGGPGGSGGDGTSTGGSTTGRGDGRGHSAALAPWQRNGGGSGVPGEGGDSGGVAGVPGVHGHGGTGSGDNTGSPAAGSGGSGDAGAPGLGVPRALSTGPLGSGGYPGGDSSGTREGSPSGASGSGGVAGGLGSAGSGSPSAYHLGPGGSGVLGNGVSGSASPPTAGAGGGGAEGVLPGDFLAGTKGSGGPAGGVSRDGYPAAQGEDMTGDVPGGIPGGVAPGMAPPGTGIASSGGTPGTAPSGPMSPGSVNPQGGGVAGGSAIARSDGHPVGGTGGAGGGGSPGGSQGAPGTGSAGQGEPHGGAGNGPPGGGGVEAYASVNPLMPRRPRGLQPAERDPDALPDRPPEGDTPPGSPRRKVLVQGGGGSDEPGDGGPAAPNRFATPTAGPQKPRKPAALRPAWVHGGRDWTIYLECLPDGVKLYPSERVFPLAQASAAGEGNALVGAVRQMIDRRQAARRPGEPPYHPQVCLLVRPENVRTFLYVYPALEALPVPKTRRNLDPDDDVAGIVTGANP